MMQINELHRQAMQQAEEADAAVRSGDEAAAQVLYRAAFQLEREAAERLIAESDAEPTRSVLLRSAASLAVSCLEYREAERLIAAGLAGHPPAEICAELRGLLETLYAQTDLLRATN